MSPGWQFRTVQIFSRTPMGSCLTVPRQRAEIVGGRIPVTSASSFCVMFASASNAFR
nr:MAG TPA: hypothetical protein [Caudoviricetes sp.]